MDGLPIVRNNELVIGNYLRHLELKDYKDRTIFNKVWQLVPFFQFTNYKPVTEVTRQDIESYMLFRKKTKKPNTVHTNMTELHFFFKWLLPDNTFFESIKTKNEKNRLPVTSILTQSEVLQMVSACNCQRDRALIFCLWETAGRLDEVLSIKIKDIQFDKYGAVVTVKGKTGMRRVRVIDSVPDIQLYINQMNRSPEDYLFPAAKKKTKLSQRGTGNMIDRVAASAGLDKHVHPHLFRHSRLTHLVKQGFSEMELRIMAGWENTSSMPAIYLHLSDKDTEDKILAMHGIIHEERKEEPIKAAIKVCPRCQVSNPFDSLFCRSCSMVLDPKEARRLEAEAVQQVDRSELETLKAQYEKLNNLFSEFAEGVFAEDAETKQVKANNMKRLVLLPEEED